MSKRRDLQRRAEERWPNLTNLLAVHFNQDFDVLYGSPEGAIAAAAQDVTLAYRKSILREWRDWQIEEGASDDLRSSLERMGVDLLFDKAADARLFMNILYDRLIEGVRAEVGKDWKP
jgi:hypothetical protein